MSVDAARYDVSNGLRAFGLRAAQHGSSAVNPCQERALWRYTFDNSHYRPVTANTKSGGGIGDIEQNLFSTIEINAQRPGDGAK